MLNMKKMLLLASAAMALMTGCMSTNTNDGAVAAPITMRNKEYIADVTVQKTAVSGEATANCLFGFITWGVSEYADEAFVKNSGLGISLGGADTVVKQGATYQACEAAKADYLLGAKYRIDTSDYFIFKKVKCTATGYPATIKGVKEVATTTVKTTKAATK
jgi:hypothetical protein